MPRKKQKYVKPIVVGSDKNPCYVLKCFVCKDKILGECRCPIEFDVEKPVYYRGTCTKCLKKAKPL